MAKQKVPAWAVIGAIAIALLIIVGVGWKSVTGDDRTDAIREHNLHPRLLDSQGHPIPQSPPKAGVRKSSGPAPLR